MFNRNPASRHIPQERPKAVEACPECKGVGYVGPILGLNPCPRGCAEAKADETVWSEQERLERLGLKRSGGVLGDKRGSGK